MLLQWPCQLGGFLVDMAVPRVQEVEHFLAVVQIGRAFLASSRRRRERGRGSSTASTSPMVAAGPLVKACASRPASAW